MFITYYRKPLNNVRVWKRFQDPPGHAECEDFWKSQSPIHPTSPSFQIPAPLHPSLLPLPLEMLWSVRQIDAWPGKLIFFEMLPHSPTAHTAHTQRIHSAYTAHTQRLCTQAYTAHTACARSPCAIHITKDPHSKDVPTHSYRTSAHTGPTDTSNHTVTQLQYWNEENITINVYIRCMMRHSNVIYQYRI